jgi:hypothetical protein
LAGTQSRPKSPISVASRLRVAVSNNPYRSFNFEPELPDYVLRNAQLLLQRHTAVTATDPLPSKVLMAKWEDKLEVLVVIGGFGLVRQMID